VTSTAAVKLFTFDLLVRERERAGGIHHFPYFLGKVLAYHLELLVYPLGWVTGYFFFIASYSTFARYWFTFFLLHLALSGLSNFIAIVFEKVSLRLMRYKL
jgi:hypothetical protein